MSISSTYNNIVSHSSRAVVVTKSNDATNTTQQRDELIVDYETQEQKEKRRQIGLIINQCLKALPARERFIIQARHLHGLTLDSLAKSFDLSIESVRQLQELAEKKMHKYVQSKLNPESLED